jgi:hypothetical protein
MDQIIELVQMISNQLVTWYNNFTRNAIHMWDDMTLLKYIRLIAIVGAYALLRPYIMKWGEKLQAKEHEKELDPYEMATADAKEKGKLSPNDLRGVGVTGAGGKVVELNGSESEEETTGADVKWGKKARKRQRAVVNKILADEEEVRRQLQEDDEDKDIQEYLVDYTPGEDGW